MDRQDSSKPLSIIERASIARFLEQAHAALLDDRVTPERGPIVLGFLIDALHRASVDVRRGYRAADIDSITRDLARRVEQLATGDRVT